jgi:hypothetical protein
MVPLFGCTGRIKKLPGGFRASGSRIQLMQLGTLGQIPNELGGTGA